MTADEVRVMVLSLPDAIEGAHHGHPDFRIGKSIFATLLPDKNRSVVRIPTPIAEGQEDGATFRIVSRHGDVCWLAAELPGVLASEWQALLELAYATLAAKKAKV